MATPYDGGILTGMLQGWRTGQQDHDSGARFKLQDARAAESHRMQMESMRQQDDLRRQQAELTELGFDEKRIAASAARNKAQMGRAFQYGRDSGDWSSLIGAFNSGPGSELGVKLAALTYAPDGRRLVATTAEGESLEFADVDQLGAAVSAYGDPTAYSQGLVGMQRSRSAPAALQKTEAVFSRLQPLPGESEDDRWMRAFEIARQGGGRGAAPRGAGARSADQPSARGSRYSMAKLLDEPATGAAPARAVAPGSRGGPRPAAATAPKPAAARSDADWRGANAAGLFGASVITGSAGYDNPADSRGRIVRTGRRADGTRVAQFEDGSIAPL